MSDGDEIVNGENLIPENIRDIKDAPKRRGRPKKDPSQEPEAEKKQKPKKADLFEAIYAAITQLPTALLPKPNFNISVVELARGFRTPVEVLGEDGIITCRRVESLDTIAAMILKYTRTTLAPYEEFRFTPGDATECAKYWFMAFNSIPNPPLIRYANEPGICWNRVPFQLKRGATPHFDELFSRMSNALAVKAWIGSLFINESYDQQYVWIRGEGNDGKSSLMEFLASVFGDEGSLSQSEAPGQDKHWAEGWIGKRFVFFPDFEDVYALKKGPLKMITGGDRITIRPMFKPGTHSIKLSAKIMFSSNPEPRFEFNKSDKRRLIYAEMLASSSRMSSTYGQRLWAEGGAFLASCIDVYNEVCPTHDIIPIEEGSFDVLEDRRSRFDVQDYQLWFDFYFREDPTAECAANEVADAIRLAYSDDYKSRIGAYNWLERKGFKLKQYKKDKVQYRAYKGLARKKLNSNPDSVAK
jgi:hypothetical protein